MSKHKHPQRQDPDIPPNLPPQRRTPEEHYAESRALSFEQMQYVLTIWWDDQARMAARKARGLNPMPSPRLAPRLAAQMGITTQTLYRYLNEKTPSAQHLINVIRQDYHADRSSGKRPIPTKPFWEVPPFP